MRENRFYFVILLLIAHFACWNCSHNELTEDDLDEDLINLLKGEHEIEDWLKSYNAKAKESAHQLTEFDYAYETNICDRTSQALLHYRKIHDSWNKKQVKTARSYMEELKTNGLLESAPDVARQLMLISASTTPIDDKVDEKIANLATKLESHYGRGKVVYKGKPCPGEPCLENLMETSRDYNELLWAWSAWRNVTRELKHDYVELTRLNNIGARDNGYSDLSAAWRFNDMEMDSGLKEMALDLWRSMKPLYEQLHAYVRRKLHLKYGTASKGPIEAHILGNMWGQQWQEIIDIVAPYPEEPEFDVTKEMKEQKWDCRKIFNAADSFFQSIGLDPMTKTFWSKTVMIKPNDKDMQCHASAEDFYSSDEFAIKMCCKVSMSNLQTVAHEMGHIQYFMLYSHQPFVYRNGANAAFHEAIGDTVALSVMNPSYLKKISLLKDASHLHQRHVDRQTINFLMKMALEKVAFLPYGLLIDLYRWRIFSGKIRPEHYNREWWKMRLQYQGLVPPIKRTENDFDAIAKFHVASNTPYIRYFFAFIGQFQFHESLLKHSGHKGPTHEGNIGGSKAAGSVLKKALGMGCSRKWPEVMNILTGGESFSAEPMLKYFEPLHEWLQQENNKNKEVIGW